jgi:hypothetical protein
MQSSLAAVPINEFGNAAPRSKYREARIGAS